jgi:hypothetical protein
MPVVDPDIIHRLDAAWYYNGVLKHGSPGVCRRYRVDFAYPVKYSSYTRRSLRDMKSLRAKSGCRERLTIAGQVDEDAHRYFAHRRPRAVFLVLDRWHRRALSIQ